ncbi:MAG: tetraprenyl-beta-curcumene synthase family protein [Syntrophales bacterium]
MTAPRNLAAMTTRIFLDVRPRVHHHLQAWTARAGAIPDPELRRQALMSIGAKSFHCEGGGIYALLAGDAFEEAVRFIVAYQTISDYLDNLCDRSTSQDPEDFQALHESMPQALIPGSDRTDWYRLHAERDDGGYLAELVETCRGVLRRVPSYGSVAPGLLRLAGLYGDLQVHKHVRPDDRLPRLEAWFATHKNGVPDLRWYEFAAATGSTLGIFCLVSSAFREGLSEAEAGQVEKSLFPWVQALHILLDYLVDQEEDRQGGDLNFCSYYSGEEDLLDRMKWIFIRAEEAVRGLPETPFHRMIIRGLLGIYLADRKVDRQAPVRRMARKLVRIGGPAAVFFFLHCLAYRRFRER